MESSTKLTDPAEARVFSSVISGLEKSYPKEKLEEISTSFCFICLLHLANEQGLRLESANDETQDKDDVENIVGSIRDLKVCVSFIS
jgi:condensin complex subunit 2